MDSSLRDYLEVENGHFWGVRDGELVLGNKPAKVPRPGDLEVVEHVGQDDR